MRAAALLVSVAATLACLAVAVAFHHRRRQWLKEGNHVDKQTTPSEPLPIPTAAAPTDNPPSIAPLLADDPSTPASASTSLAASDEDIISRRSSTGANFKRIISRKSSEDVVAASSESRSRLLDEDEELQLSNPSLYVDTRSVTLPVCGMRTFLCRHPLGESIPSILILHDKDQSVAAWHRQLWYFGKIATVIAPHLSDKWKSLPENELVDHVLSCLAEAKLGTSDVVLLAAPFAAHVALQMLDKLSTLHPPRAVVLIEPQLDGALLTPLLEDLDPDVDGKVPLLTVVTEEAQATAVDLLLSSFFSQHHVNLLEIKEAITEESESKPSRLVLVSEGDLLNAVVTKFLIEEAQLTEMSLQYQLNQTAPAADKWSLKNLEKWKKTDAVSNLVEGTLFRPMKVMRQNDEDHSPSAFMGTFINVGTIIDLSREAPPYNTQDPALPDYQKLPCISKSVPEPSEVARFIAVARAYWAKHPEREIAVHCHYGFNRTGFMICSYLIDVLGLSVSESLRRFANARPPGIKHQHFKDELLLRHKHVALLSPSLHHPHHAHGRIRRISTSSDGSASSLTENDSTHISVAPPTRAIST